MGGDGSCTKFGAHMGLGTKNRQKQTADICKQHLREKYRDQRQLVEEFIWSLRVTVKTAMSLAGTASPTSKTLKKRCSSASRRISRSGLIRELNETRANCRRAGKYRQRDWGLQSGEREGKRSRDWWITTSTFAN
jgi:hypothetical protein